MLRLSVEEVWPATLTVCQEVQDPVSQVLELAMEPGWHYGVKCRAVVHKQHPHIGGLTLQVGEGRVEDMGDGIFCAPGSIGKLQAVLPTQPICG